ncbi:hypothetical protein MMC12_002902 [Toensbergia leucococca]|nr:hypothetical protein [Toensbergia leucococca]
MAAWFTVAGWIIAALSFLSPVIVWCIKACCGRSQDPTSEELVHWTSLKKAIDAHDLNAGDVGWATAMKLKVRIEVMEQRQPNWVVRGGVATVDFFQHWCRKVLKGLFFLFSYLYLLIPGLGLGLGLGLPFLIISLFAWVLWLVFRALRWILRSCVSKSSRRRQRWTARFGAWRDRRARGAGGGHLDLEMQSLEPISSDESEGGIPLNLVSSNESDGGVLLNVVA